MATSRFQLQVQQSGRRPQSSLQVKRAAAFQDLVLAAQNGVEFHDTTLVRLVALKDKNTGLLLCGGRVQSWNEEGAAVPLIPYES